MFVCLLSELLSVALIQWSQFCYDTCYVMNKLASLEATLVRNSAHPLTYSLTDLLTGVKCRATSVAKKEGKYIYIVYVHSIGEKVQEILGGPNNSCDSLIQETSF